MLLSDFLASWASSACGTFIMHPVDTVRVRYQTRNHSPLYTLRNERFVALYSGIVTPITVGGPINALVFMCNDGIKIYMHRVLTSYGLLDDTAPSCTHGGAAHDLHVHMSDLVRPEEEDSVWSTEGVTPSAVASSSSSSSSMAASASDGEEIATVSMAMRSSGSGNYSSSSTAEHHALLGPTLPMWAVMISGGAAGLAGTLIACPAATIRVQQQVRAISSHLSAGGASCDGSKLTCDMPKSSARNLAPVHIVVKDLFITEGIRGFYRAFLLEGVANVIGRSTYFGFYEGFKRAFGRFYVESGLFSPPLASAPLSSSAPSAPSEPQRAPISAKDAELLIPVRVAAASVASVVSWWSIYPLDLLKNKLQAEPTVRSQRLYGNGTVRECARITYKAGGWRAFYVGFPITALRGSCTGMINLPLYDTLKPIFRKRMAEESGGGQQRSR